jgi:hypothetical protein
MMLYNPPAKKTCLSIKAGAKVLPETIQSKFYYNIFEKKLKKISKTLNVNGKLFRKFLKKRQEGKEGNTRKRK